MIALSANMETISKRKMRGLPVLNKNEGCNFEGYDASLLMSETAKLGNLITKRGTLEILIPLCCSTNPVRHKQFRQDLKRVEYTLTTKGQKLVESVADILQWMRKWATSKKR
jgi:hypothetical protein